jgi:cytochrome c-type biogenesis protein CcmF
LKNTQVSVGAPYFNTVAVPVGLALLFLMAVAPALSWRKVDAEVLWSRLVVPAWAGVLVVVGCVIAGVRGVTPLVAFGLGAFAAASAIRSLVLSVRASRRRGAGAWRGLVGRTNGGMVVHLGIVLLAVGMAAATSYAQRSELALRPHQTVHFDGHSFVFEGLRQVTSPASVDTQAVVRVDGRGLFYPAVTAFGGGTSDPVQTPAIDSGFFGDVYLTFDATGAASQGGSSSAQVIANLPANAVAVGVVVEPLIDWMWVGGMLVGLGGLLALWPGGRRRPTDPVSAPAPVVLAAADGPNGNGNGSGNGTGQHDDDRSAGVGSDVPIGVESP